MPVAIRLARPVPADAEALLAVERHSLGDSPYTPEEVLAILRRPEHRTYLALAEGQPIGFCSSLETATDAGPRLELDMLGVLPDHRGRGTATALLRAAMAEATERGTGRFRGIVAADNVASQRAFEKAGLQRRGVLCDLKVYDVRGDAPLPYLPEGWRAGVTRTGVQEVPGHPPLRFGADGAGREVVTIHDAKGRPVALGEVQEVHTLSYCGLWLECLWTEPGRALLVLALGLVERARALGLDEVGYLAPHERAAPGEGDDAVTWARAGYRVVGRYYIYLAGQA